MEQFDQKAAECRFFFRKENRLLKRADFLRVYNHGKPYRRSLVHVFVLRPGQLSGSDEHDLQSATNAQTAATPAPTRLGITATKKTGKAVRRNRGRRLVRESFRLALPDMAPGYWMVVNLTRAANQAPFAKVDAQLKEIWQAAGVLAQTE